MSDFLQMLITGLKLGSVYALIALGYTMVYGIIRLINFAHGDFIMVGGYTLIFSFPVFYNMGLPLWMAIIAAIIVCATVGILVELLAYRPIRKKGTGMSALITAISMSFLLQNLAQAIPAIGPDPKSFRTIFPSKTISIGSVKIDFLTILTIVVCGIIMIALQLFVKKTKLGRAMRAVSEDKQAAIVTGINVNKTIIITFAIGASLAAVAALMYFSQYKQVRITSGSIPGLQAFIAAVLGGIGIIPGAMLGGFIIGLAESFVTSYISSSLASAFVYLILIIVLIIKPSGILGKNVGEKV